MSDGVPTTRIEDHGDEVLVTVTDLRDVSRVLNSNTVFTRRGTRTDALSDADAITFQSLYTNTNYSDSTIRISSARQFNSETNRFRPSPGNLAYYEVDIKKRNLTEAEAMKYDESFHSPPDSIYEIRLPPMSAFRSPHESGQMQLLIPRSECERLIDTLQSKIEQANWINTKLSYTGYPTNLPPEWNPESADNTRSELREGAKNRYYTLKETWKDVFGVSYIECYSARRQVLGETEPKLELREIPALSLVPDSENESYCQFCGGIGSVTQLLQVSDKLDRERRVCEHCADQWNDFTDDAVQKALDDRAKQTGGQRVFHEGFPE